MNSITDKQMNYIEILSSYPSTKKEDKADIDNFLKEKNKSAVQQLSKREASELIGLLLKRPVEYTFKCGKTAFVEKQDANKFDLFGSFEGCLHECPDTTIRGDVNSCPHYKDEMEELY